MEIHEPRQVRKEAAVSEPFHVPQGSLAGANCWGNVRSSVTEDGCMTLNIPMIKTQMPFEFFCYSSPISHLWYNELDFNESVEGNRL